MFRTSHRELLLAAEVEERGSVHMPAATITAVASRQHEACHAEPPI